MSDIAPPIEVVYVSPLPTKRMYVYEYTTQPPQVGFLEPNQGSLTQAPTRNFYTNTTSFRSAAEAAFVEEEIIDIVIQIFNEYE
jgi:hypothetical protein